jgi:hypothetical protein
MSQPTRNVALDSHDTHFLEVAQGKIRLLTLQHALLGQQLEQLKDMKDLYLATILRKAGADPTASYKPSPDGSMLVAVEPQKENGGAPNPNPE